MRVLLVCLLCLSTYAAGAQQREFSDWKRVDSFLNTQVSGDVPGLAVGIIRDGKPVYEKYLGLSNLQHRVPVDSHTRFNLASVAKQFTALCVLKLAEEKRFSLEDDFRRYLPAYYPGIREAMPIATLITHTSGIRDYYDLMMVQGQPWWRREGLENREALELLKKQKSLNFSPGRDYLYSNSNYTLLAELVEKVTGQTLLDYSASLFRQLGMTHTSFVDNYMAVLPNQAQPYTDWGDGQWQQFPMMVNVYGDGFLYTTLPDMIRYEQQLQQSRTRAGNHWLLQSQGPLENIAVRGYGFGLELDSIRGHAAVHHPGSTGSYHAQVMRFPEQKLSIVVMSNNGRLWSGTIADELAGMLLPSRVIRAPRTEMVATTKTEKNNWTPDTTYLQEFVGVYRNEELDCGYRIFWDEKKELRLQSLARRNSNPLQAVDRDAFTDPNYSMRFVRDASGKVKQMVISFNRVRGIEFDKTAN